MFRIELRHTRNLLLSTGILALWGLFGCHALVKRIPFSSTRATFCGSLKVLPSDINEVDEVDYVVIGSGIGGLSCASLLNYYGYNVAVLESHYLPGGCAHTFEKNGFKFDAGPSLWNGMATPPYNPLREVFLEVVGQVRHFHMLLLDFRGDWGG